MVFYNPKIEEIIFKENVRLEFSRLQERIALARKMKLKNRTLIVSNEKLC